MENIWKEKTSYFVKLPKVVLQQILDDNLVQLLGYPEKEEGYTFEDATFQLKYLTNDEIICGIQLRNAAHLKEKCVKDYITEDDFGRAKSVYGQNSFYTIDEYKAYVPKMVENPDFVEGGDAPEFIALRDEDGNVLHEMP